MKYSLGILFASSLLSQAATIARWTPISVAADPVIGATYDQTSDTPAADESNSNVTVSTLQRINPLDTGNDGNVWSGFVSSSFVLNEYTAFSFQANSGFTVTPNTLTYDFNSFGGNDAQGYTGTIRTSLDNFASDVSVDTIFNDSAGRFSFDLSSLGTLTEEVEVRLYAVSNSGNGIFVDLIGTAVEANRPNLGYIFEGDVNAVPEPSSFILSLLGGLGLLARRKRS